MQLTKTTKIPEDKYLDVYCNDCDSSFFVKTTEELKCPNCKSKKVQLDTHKFKNIGLY